jgi:cyanophycinase-like exopeptidase
MTRGADGRGTIALHGGGEFQAGDEPFLDALLRAARRDRSGEGEAGTTGDPLRVVVVPSAAAREQPALAARHGVDALTHAGERIDIKVDATPLLIVDRDSATDPGIVGRLADADLIYLPGGHPDLIPALLHDTAAWGAIVAAHARGAVIAGASAGAMGLADRTWTPFGWRDGLHMVPGLIVVPHFSKFDLRGWESAIAELDAAGLGRLGLDERTGVLSDGDGRSWHVIGEGQVHWFPVGADPVVAAHGETITLRD